MHLSGQLRHDSRVHSGVIQCKTVGIFNGINLDLISRAAGEEPTEDGTTNGGLGSGAPRSATSIRYRTRPAGHRVAERIADQPDEGFGLRFLNATAKREHHELSDKTGRLPEYQGLKKRGKAAALLPERRRRCDQRGGGAHRADCGERPT
jgi:hypothetical protein